MGIDIGSTSVKAAVIGETENWEFFRDIGEKSVTLSLVNDNFFSKPILISEYRRIKGDPLKATLETLNEIYAHFSEINGQRATGSGSRLISNLLDIQVENEFKALSRGVGSLYPNVRTIFEMGGNSSKYIRIEKDSSGKTGIHDYEKNGECAAGTGSFIDQQATRLKYEIEDLGDIVIEAEKSPIIAGRCSVFAKSDMVHAQQKGYTPPQILKGLCTAVVRNFKGNITKTKKIVPKVAFIGGVAANKGVVQAMKSIYELSDDELFVPEYHAWIGAIGTAIIESENRNKSKSRTIDSINISQTKNNEDFPSMKQLSSEKVILLRDRIKPYTFEGKELPIDVIMGIDIGSVSTNFAIIDDVGNLIMEIYTKTCSRPIEVVDECLKEIMKKIGKKINIKSVGTTGSGRELIGKLIGADIIVDEITAHKTGASFIGEKLINQTPDTIFEIGGQDAKFISIHDDVVVDFAMNEACAAGTGSFLEEQAEKMDVNIVNQFSKLALNSTVPIRLGERCTVFMEKEIPPLLQKGATREALCAGLAYSIAINYLNRVVRDRKVGNSIFFQGGTAYNDSVAAAFSTLLDKKIIVPPHNGVIGAIGAALLSRKKVGSVYSVTRFRGFDTGKIKYKLKEFTCKGCSNFCDIQQFNVEDDITYWGDKCSEKYRKHTKCEKKSVLPDILKLRQGLLLRNYIPNKHNGVKIGIPRSMYFFDRFQFWFKLFDELGFNIVLSDPTNRNIISSGISSTVAEPCFPIKVSHGHTCNLLEKKVDFIFLPNIIDMETEFIDVNSHLCPWGQTETYVIGHSSLFEGKEDMILRPRIHFRDGIQRVRNEIFEMTRRFKISRRRSNKAVEAAYNSMSMFTDDLQKLGMETLRKVEKTGTHGIVLVGRPYNIYDNGINLDVPQKLIDYYGTNLIPMDLLPIKGIDISDVNDSMYWNYGKKILQTAKFISNFSNLHLIYITNFTCGPDSYIKHFIMNALKKPFLTLQFDEHANDAGIITRIEAYLNSNGLL